MLGTEIMTLCFTSSKTSCVFVEEGFNLGSLSKLSLLDPSLLSTDYYGLSRGVSPISTLCFDDFRVSLYNDLGSGLDLQCNYVLMQDEQEIGFFGAKLSGGTLIPVPVTAKGLRRYLLAQRSRRIPMKSEVDIENSNGLLGMVKTSAAVSRAQSFFEDIRAGEPVSTGSWMNLLYAPDCNYFTRPTAALVGIRQCNTDSAALAEEIVLEGSEESLCFSKLEACLSSALTNNTMSLASPSVAMHVIVNTNEFNALSDKLLLQKEEFKKSVDMVLTKLVTDAQSELRLQLDSPWDITVNSVVELPAGMPLVNEGATFEEICAENQLSQSNGGKKNSNFR